MRELPSLAMSESTKVLVYVTGDDSDLRAPLYSMLASGLITHCDRVDKSALVIDEKKREKVKSTGMMFMLHTTREHYSAVLDRLRRVSDTTAHAVPVLDSI